MLPHQLFEKSMVSRKGKEIQVMTRDGKTNVSDTVESNLLYEILMEMRKKK